MVYVVMGVSGCGKSTIASELARRLNLPFHDADDYHPQSNIDKMRSGVPLEDGDREPWLKIISEEIAGWNRSGGAVLACSALKEKYRAILRGENPPQDLIFICLAGAKETILRRMKAREGHFMPPDLLDSQFAALEEPREGITVSIDQEPELICKEIMEKLRRKFPSV
jgi:carbohydrate kinase (thermoresistant glucokinase family)